MGKYLFFIILNIIIFQTNIIEAQIISRWNQDSLFYFYSPVDENLTAQKTSFVHSMTKEEILDSITSFLSSTYFASKNEYYKNKTKIKIELDSLITVNAQNRVYRIAVINISDPDEICLGYYFQGTSGGYSTFLTLVANLMQPQKKIPLLDGIIFLYNEKELKEMDHINLEGLISEGEIDNGIKKAIKQ